MRSLTVLAGRFLGAFSATPSPGSLGEPQRPRLTLNNNVDYYSLTWHEHKTVDPHLLSLLGPMQRVEWDTVNGARCRAEQCLLKDSAKTPEPPVVAQGLLVKGSCIGLRKVCSASWIWLPLPASRV